jgi:para-nitrobenzyl esterase
MAMSERDERVTTNCGPVVGFTREGVVRWRSIPYARPPVGPLRLRAPEPPAPWRIARYCEKFAFAAPQRRLYIAMMGKLQPTSEDCLTLNVTAPAHISDQPLPVMFWIHGGAYIMGTSATYDGAHLARQGCVYVSVNYRVGALGCMDLSSLSTAKHPIDSNLFLRDLVMALHWVRDNIAAFGGDPNRVTIFGESAGAHAVMTLLATPAARGLFSRAIIQSTTNGLVRTAAEAADFAVELAALLGAGPQDAAETVMQADCSRLADVVEQMLKASTGETVGLAPFGPAIDGDYLPRDPVDAMERGEANPAALIVGSTADEARAFTRGPLAYMPLTEPLIEEMLAVADPAVRQQVLSAYPGYPQRDACIQLGGDRFFSAGGWQVAEAHSRHLPTYVYRYDYSPRILRRLGFAGAHGTDLLATFDLYRRSRIARLLTAAGDHRTALRVSDDLQSRWLAFAATANPGNDWPAYADPKRAMMIFDRKSRVEADPVSARRLAWREFVRAG